MPARFKAEGTRKQKKREYIYIYLLTTNLILIPIRLTHSILLEKVLIVKLLKKFPAFYGTRRFIAVFTRALYSSLS
jgi:hypothetical protein